MSETRFKLEHPLTAEHFAPSAGAGANLTTENRSQRDIAKQQQSEWVGGLATWDDGEIAYISVAFTWKLKEARDLALWYRSIGRRVIAGGPATLKQQDVATPLRRLAQSRGASGE